MAEYVKWGPRFQLAEDKDLRRLKAEMEARLGMKLTDRQFLLLKDTALPAPSIPMGPHMRVISHDVLSPDPGIDQHVLGGLDTGAEHERLLERMRAKKGRG